MAKVKTMKEIFVELVGKTMKDMDCLNPAERVNAQATLALALATAGLENESAPVEEVKAEAPAVKEVAPKKKAKELKTETNFEEKLKEVKEKHKIQEVKPVVEKVESERDKLKDKAEVIEPKVETPVEEAKAPEVKAEEPAPAKAEVQEEIDVEKVEDDNWTKETQEKYANEIAYIKEVSKKVNTKLLNDKLNTFSKGIIPTIGHIKPSNILFVVKYIKSLEEAAKKAQAQG